MTRTRYDAAKGFAKYQTKMARRRATVCAQCGHPESQHDCCPLRCEGCGEGFIYHSFTTTTTTGNPECIECHREFEPLDLDPDGVCRECLNRKTPRQIVADFLADFTTWSQVGGRTFGEFADDLLARLAGDTGIFIPVPTKSRRRIVEGCGYCATYGKESMTPYHDASARCESGKYPHCTCDTCF